MRYGQNASLPSACRVGHSESCGLVDAGVVEVILKDFEDARIPIHAIWPAGKIPLAKTRLFVDELAVRLKRESL